MLLQAMSPFQSGGDHIALPTQLTLHTYLEFDPSVIVRLPAIYSQVISNGLRHSRFVGELRAAHGFH